MAGRFSKARWHSPATRIQPALPFRLWNTFMRILKAPPLASDRSSVTGRCTSAGAADVPCHGRCGAAVLSGLLTCLWSEQAILSVMLPRAKRNDGQPRESSNSQRGSGRLVVGHKCWLRFQAIVGLPDATYHYPDGMARGGQVTPDSHYASGVTPDIVIREAAQP